MRLSRLFGNTLREAPADAKVTCERLLLRAGMVRRISTGVYSYLPLGWKVVNKIEHLLREEMQSIGAQEMFLPTPQPTELLEWGSQQASSHPVLAPNGDQHQREPPLAPSLEATTLLAHREIHSYRQLPCMIYQIQSKIREQPSARRASIGAHESIIMEGFSFHADRADLDVFSEQVLRAYEQLLQHCGVDVLGVQGYSPALAEPTALEFVAMHDAGEQELFICNACGYIANAQIATSAQRPGTRDPQAALERVVTPGVTTIADLSSYLEVAPHQTLKTLCYVADGEPVLVVIRGDLDVNETKLARLLHAENLRMADHLEAEQSGIRAGYASPVGLKAKIRLVGDESIGAGSNFVAGANEEGYHLRNVNYPRDFGVDLIGHFAVVRDGDPCPGCLAPLRSARGFTLARVSKIGTAYSRTMGAGFTDKAGRPQPLVMGLYSLDLTRLVCVAVEQHHDERGITWPPSIAPFHVHLVSLGERREMVKIADSVYEELAGSGLQLLYDDREENAGVKFADADLIGVPLRLTVGPRSLAEGGIELKPRTLDRTEIVPLHEVLERVSDIIEKDRPGSATVDGERMSRQRTG